MARWNLLPNRCRTNVVGMRALLIRKTPGYVYSLYSIGRTKRARQRTPEEATLGPTGAFF